MSSREQSTRHSLTIAKERTSPKKRPIPEPYSNFPGTEFGREIVIMKRAEWLIRNMDNGTRLTDEERSARFEKFYTRFPNSKAFLDQPHDNLQGRKPLDILEEKIKGEKAQHEQHRQEIERRTLMRRKKKKGERVVKPIVMTERKNVKVSPPHRTRG